MDPIPTSSFRLPGYEAGPETSGVDYSAKKLEAAANCLKPVLPQHLEIQSRPLSSSLGSWSYRCRCSFQIVPVGDRYEYAMRHRGEPVPLGVDHFPIATRRIQMAMKLFMQQVLNAGRTSTTTAFADIKRNLASVTFSSAWQDRNDSDCIMTLNYDQAICEEQWKQEAEIAAKVLGLRQLNGRSKKILLSAVGGGKQTIRDTVYISKQMDAFRNWQVRVDPFPSESPSSIEIYYEKPETAFFHPNAFAMTDALKWMLDCIDGIVSSSIRPVKLLEMYCGCGAHTIAIAKTGLLDGILAVELDRRLVDACEKNVRANNLQNKVKVVQGDAGKFARELKKRRQDDFSILLVDPPRAGLDKEVCTMALQGAFQHFLYVSCGHKALLRDLEILAPWYEVESCTQLDLFPRTDSIETLVHLRRKSIQSTQLL